MSKILPISIIVLLIIIGCSGGGGSDDGSFVGLLDIIPDTPETRKEVWMTDFAHVRELFGIVIPPSDADEDALVDYLIAITHRGTTDKSGGRVGLRLTNPLLVALKFSS